MTASEESTGALAGSAVLVAPGRWIKAGEDYLLGASLLVLTSPLLLLIAMAVRCTSRGPVIFRQDRVGRDGRRFSIWKFRTMFWQLDPSGPSNSGALQACFGDGRITFLGGILRRWSLDELPQIVNVLRGEMSLVGPRPHPLPLDERFMIDLPHLPGRRMVKPGITGLAQISGARGPTADVSTMKRRIDFDFEYVRHWSLALDLSILLRTALVGWHNQHP
jgi:putative colanic acid biosynthesis UDP-glucose lipid carrier transferase